MSITDRQRTGLHRAAEESMGPESADTLMALLPPVGWADVATKQDIDSLRLSTKKDLEILEHRLSARFERLARNYFFAMLSSMAVLVGLAAAITRLTIPI